MYAYFLSIISSSNLPITINNTHNIHNQDQQMERRSLGYYSWLQHKKPNYSIAKKLVTSPIKSKSMTQYDFPNCQTSKSMTQHDFTNY